MHNNNQQDQERERIERERERQREAEEVREIRWRNMIKQDKVENGKGRSS
jgi:hypothetical protein